MKWLIPIVAALSLTGCAVYPVGYEAAPPVVYRPAPVYVAPAPVYVAPPTINFGFSYHRGWGGHRHGRW